MIDLYVINLNKRGDRWENIKKTFSDPYFNLIRVEAVEDKKGWIGCFMSHKKCLEIAKEKNLPYTIVIEDDCVPFEPTNFLDRFKKIVEYLETHDDWNIMIGSTASIRPSYYDNVVPFAENEYFIEFNSAFMTHMVFYNKNIYDFYINEKITKPVDEFWHKKIKALIPVPFIAKQYPNFSDIIKRNKSDELRTNEANSTLQIYLKNKLKKL